MLNNFIYAQTKDLFLEKLDAGEVLEEAVVFIADTKEIWNRGTYFGGADLSNYFTVDEIAEIYATIDSVNAKQDTLVSGTNIKTINGESILGSGNIAIETLTESDITSMGFTKNAGTVTSVATGTGLTGGTITGTGTISINSTYQGYITNGNNAWASYTTRTSVASVPITHKIVKCTISASGSFTLASTPAAGREVHVLVYNSSSADVVVSLPTASPYVNFSGDSLTVPAKGYAEINVVSDGSTMFIRHAA